MRSTWFWFFVGFVLLVLLAISLELFFGGVVTALLGRFGWGAIRTLREERGLPTDLAKQGTLFREAMSAVDKESAVLEAARVAEQARMYDAINRSIETADPEVLREEVLKNLEGDGP